MSTKLILPHHLNNTKKSQKRPVLRLKFKNDTGISFFGTVISFFGSVISFFGSIEIAQFYLNIPGNGEDGIPCTSLISRMIIPLGTGHFIISTHHLYQFCFSQIALILRRPFFHHISTKFFNFRFGNLLGYLAGTKELNDRLICSKLILLRDCAK